MPTRPPQSEPVTPPTPGPTTGQLDAARSPAHRRRAVIALAAGALAGLAGVGRARAEQGSYPSRPITLVVPYTAGGASDIGARLIAPEMGRQLGQQLIVDNVAGAAGALGVQKVVRAPADGHTLLYGSLSETLLVPLLNPKAGYRVDDLLPVAFLGGSPAVFVVRPDFPASSIDEFITLARRNPGRYSYGSPGIGSFQHVVGEAFKARAGVFMVHIPYRGGAQILNDVIGGQLDLGITSAVNAAAFVANGRLKAIGVTSAQRLATMPGTQAFGESAVLAGLELSTWGVLWAPAGTPDEVAGRLNVAARAALALPATQAQLARLGVAPPEPMSPGQLRTFVRAEQAKLSPVLARIKLD